MLSLCLLETETLKRNLESGLNQFSQNFVQFDSTSAVATYSQELLAYVQYDLPRFNAEQKYIAAFDFHLAGFD